MCLTGFWGLFGASSLVLLLRVVAACCSSLEVRCESFWFLMWTGLLSPLGAALRGAEIRVL
jgi:hypothetical protein